MEKGRELATSRVHALMKNTTPQLLGVIRLLWAGFFTRCRIDLFVTCCPCERPCTGAELGSLLSRFLPVG